MNDEYDKEKAATIRGVEKILWNFLDNASETPMNPERCYQWACDLVDEIGYGKQRYLGFVPGVLEDKTK